MARRGDEDDEAPWLAEAGNAPRTNVSKRSLFWTLLVLLSLATVAAVGLILLLSKKDSGSTQGYMNAEQAPLITAEPGPYKIPPIDPKGLAVEGEGQTIYAAGEGIDEGSIIDSSDGPEAPMPRPGSAEAPPPGPPQDLLPDMAPAPRPAATAAIPKTTPQTVANPAKPAPLPAATSAAKPVQAAPKPPQTAPNPAKKPGTVQLGAFSTTEKANAAWAGLTAKYGLIGFSKHILVVDSDGKTLYRLRASGSDSTDTCRRLKAAGVPCTVIE